MVNITLTADENSIERARVAAQAMGTSLNQFLREQIDRLAGSDQREREMQAYLASVGTGRSGGWTFNRDEIQRDVRN